MSQEVRKGGRTKLVCRQLLDLKLMEKGNEEQVQECRLRKTETQRVEENESAAIVCCLDVFSPRQKLFSTLCVNNFHPHIEKDSNPKEHKETMPIMHKNEGKQTYRVEWIALIDRHFEVSLELIKSCYLQWREEKKDLITETRQQYRMKFSLYMHMTAENHAISTCM